MHVFMITDYPGEKWKTVQFDFEYSNDYRLDISNFGRLRTYNKIAKGKILKGSMINGYRIIRLKFFTAREPKVEKYLKSLQQQVFDFAGKIRAMKQELALSGPKESAFEERKSEIEKSEKLLASLKKNLSKKFKDDLDGRTMHYHSLVHRLVAEYFCRKPSAKHTLVAHADFDKLNNHYGNLVWMTPEENHIHQQKSPIVIAGKDERRRSTGNSKVAKLTITKVMLLKKMLNQGKPMRTLVKQFKVTETQIRRIKKGENWADIEATP